MNTSPSRCALFNKFFIWYVCFIGIKGIFTRAEKLWCTQYLEKNVSEELWYYTLNDKDRRKIMTDISCSQNEVLLHEGLAETIDKDDFKAKLTSLKLALEVIALGFNCWFEDNCSEIFIECLILAASEQHSIAQCFSTNALEAKHRLLKNTLNKEERNSRCDWMFSKAGCLLLHRGAKGKTKYVLGTYWEIQAGTRIWALLCRASAMDSVVRW